MIQVIAIIFHIMMIFLNIALIENESVEPRTGKWLIVLNIGLVIMNICFLIQK